MQFLQLKIRLVYGITRSVTCRLMYIGFLVSALSSCSSLVRLKLRSMGIFDQQVVPVYIASQHKTIAFLPMHHIGVPAFYQHTRQLIDSLHREGYVVFYELVTVHNQTTPLQQDTLLRKWRKVMGGIHPDGYIDTLTGKLLGREYRFVRQLTNQPFGQQIGLDALVDVNADATLNELVAAFEKKHGAVELDSCDWRTPFRGHYACPRIYTNHQKNYFIRDYRNELLANAIQNAAHNKIVVLYGANHLEGLVELLGKNPKKPKNPQTP